MYYTQRTAGKRGNSMNTSANFHSAVSGLLATAVAGLVGANDRILLTEDGGKTWRQQTNRYERERDRMINDNKRVFFISKNEGWLVGN